MSAQRHNRANAAPLRLAAAAFLRAPWDDGTCPRIAEMVVEESLLRSYFIHLRTLHTSRMMESSCTGEVPNNERWCTVSFTKRSPRCTVGVGQARPPEPGKAFAAFPFSQFTRCRQSITTENPVPTIPPWLLPQPVPALSLSQLAGIGGVKGPPQASAPRFSSQLGYMPCKRSLSRIWLLGIMHQMHVLVVNSKLVQEMCALWRTTSNILFRAYTATDNISASSHGQMRVGRWPVRWTPFFCVPYQTLRAPQIDTPPRRAGCTNSERNPSKGNSFTSCWEHRRQIASAAKAALTKQEKSSEKDVDALTFMQTVVMSFVRGMVWRPNIIHDRHLDGESTCLWCHCLLWGKLCPSHPSCN